MPPRAAMLPARMKSGADRRTNESESRPDEARGDDDGVQRGVDHRRREGANAQGDADRHADDDEDDEDDQKGFCHRSLSAATSRHAIGRMISTAPTGIAA